MTLEQLLETPELIANYSDSELTQLLSQYYPAIRTPVLPEESTKKYDAMEATVKNLISANRDLIEQAKKALGK